LRNTLSLVMAMSSDTIEAEESCIQEAIDEDGDEPEAPRIRGFKVSKRSGCFLHVKRGRVTVKGAENRDVIITYSPDEAAGQWRDPTEEGFT
jgi:hypothetical protein